MTKVCIIGDEITVTGLKLVGMKDSYIATPETINSVLNNVSESEIIVITHSLYQVARKRIEKMKDKIIIETPDAKGGGEDIVNKIIKDVIGFEIAKR
jgi:vacuolar-type H+-ATPase subunit F/Vma7